MGEISDRMRDHFTSAFGLAESSAASLVLVSRKALTESLDRLVRAVAEADAESMIHWSHHLKGNLLNSGLAEYASLAAAIEAETLAGTTRSDAIRENVARLKAGLWSFLSDA